MDIFHNSGMWSAEAGPPLDRWTEMFDVLNQSGTVSVTNTHIQDKLHLPLHLCLFYRGKNTSGKSKSNTFLAKQTLRGIKIHGEITLSAHFR